MSENAMAPAPGPLAPVAVSLPSQPGGLVYVARLLWRDKGGLLGLILFALVVVAATFSPQLSLHDPLEQNLDISQQPPAWAAGGNWHYPLGTDKLGRDLYSRIIYGSRVSLTVGFFGVLIAGGLGLVIGLISGY